MIRYNEIPRFGDAAPTSKYDEMAFKASKEGESPKLCPPVAEFAAKVDAFFSRDPDVYTIFSYDASKLKVYVKGMKKSEAIGWLLPHNLPSRFPVDIGIEVYRVLENGELEEIPKPTYDVTTSAVVQFAVDMMRGSGIDCEYNSWHDPIMEVDHHFFEFYPVAIKFKNDNLGQPYGYTTMLAADLARELIDFPGVHVSTYARNPE